MRPEPFFGGPGFDRADLLRAEPDKIAALAADPSARELRWLDGLPELDADGRLTWQPVADPQLFLGLAPDGPRFSSVPAQAHDLRAQFMALSLLHSDDAPIFAAALSLGGWHRRHRFCATCGTPSDLVRGGWSRRCSACSAEHFPRVDPVVIMLAEHDGRVLLGRQPQYPPGRYSALAGFIEVGETIEAAVAREFGEEAGVEVVDVTYVCSQPWPFPSSLMIACTARALSADLVIDRTELDDARWFSRAEVEAAVSGQSDAAFIAPPRAAVARTLIDWWLHA